MMKEARKLKKKRVKKPSVGQKAKFKRAKERDSETALSMARLDPGERRAARRREPKKRREVPRRSSYGLIACGAMMNTGMF